jgi:hypothetical protein
MDRANVVSGLAITRDEEPVSTLQLGLALPVDGGSHVVAVTAPHKKRFTTTVTVPPKEGTVTVTIPALEDEPIVATGGSEPATPITQPSQGTSGSGRRIAGLITGVVGLAGLAFGGAAGLVATLDWNASNSTDNGCNSGTTTCLTQHGIDLRSSAQTWATVANVALVAGGVVLVAGVIVFLTAPRASRTLAFSPGGVGVRF